MSRLRILTLFAVLIALATAFAACGGSGGSDDPQTVVDEATLQGIESGQLDLTLGVDIKGKKGGHVDVSLSGPFQGASEGEAPELDLTAKAKGRVDGEKVDFDAGLTLLGNKAYVGYDGTEYEVDPTTFSFVKSIISQGSGGKQSDENPGCQEAVSELKVGDFIDDLRDGGSAEVAGASTTKVSGDLDAPGAIEALIELTEDSACADQLSGAGPLPSTAELEDAKSTVEDSVKSAQVELYVGDDNIVRRITAQVTVEPEGSGAEDTETVDLDLDLTLSGVNEDQTISGPGKTKPLSELFLKLGINPIELASAFSEGGGLGGSAGLDSLLEGLGGGSDDEGSSGGGKPEDGRQAYLSCLKEASTPVDLQDCTRLLQ